MKLFRKMLPLLACGVSLLWGGAFAPNALVAHADQINLAASPDLNQPGPPLRDGERVLFRFRAPTNAQKVFLAGSFNNYADNVNGAVTDDKYALTNAGDGVYSIRAFVKPDLENYKFVVLNRNGGFDWLADPQVQTLDKDGNSVLDFSQIERIAPAADRAGPPVRNNGQVLFRFRAPAETQKVYLAGSFNNYADNKDGVISDERFAFTPGADGLYTKRENIGDTTENYKFVVVDKNGQTTWLTDPEVQTTDEQGNSVVNFGAIEKLP